jgi:transcription antitermination factor NusG
MQSPNVNTYGYSEQGPRSFPGGPTPQNISTPPRWFAIYTFPRHEKLVAEQLNQRAFEFYLPLFERVHGRKNRKKKVQLPLFPSYVFVRMSINERLRVLNLAGVVRLVGVSGCATPVPEGEIESLRQSLQLRRAEPYPFLAVGKPVRINGGALEGLEGVILRRKGNLQLVISISSIKCSIAVHVDAADLELMSLHSS